MKSNMFVSQELQFVNLCKHFPQKSEFVFDEFPTITSNKFDLILSYN